MDARREIMQGFAQDAVTRGRHFFYVRIPESVGPMDRGAKYEVLLIEALRDFGEVSGGGSQLGVGDSIAFCGLDVEVADREQGLAIIRQTMRACGAPRDTVIEEYEPNYRELPL